MPRSVPATTSPTAAFAYTETPRDEDGQRLYLSCETLTPGESVIVVGLSASADDFDDSLDAADAFLDDGLTVREQSLDIDGFTDRTDTLSHRHRSLLPALAPDRGR